MIYEDTGTPSANHSTPPHHDDDDDALLPEIEPDRTEVCLNSFVALRQEIIAERDRVARHLFQLLLLLLELPVP